MSKVLYVFQSGRLKRKDNSLILITKEGENKSIPVATVSDINIFGEIVINKRLLEFLTKNEICLHFFNRKGWYVGSYYPRRSLNSGLITLKQAEAYLDNKKRVYLAKKFIEGAYRNILKNLEYHYRQTGNEEIGNSIKNINQSFSKVFETNDIPTLMSIEGDIRKEYYSTFGLFLKQEGFEIERREKRPPSNPMNALISFGNSLLYASVLSEIYRTYLDPRIGYLHQTNQRSFSLNLDIAEVFKPVIVDRTIFQIINRKEININDFHEIGDGVFMKESGNKKFIQRYEEKMQSVIKHKKLGNVSYRRLIRLECYKLYKFFTEDEEYNPFVVEW
ncbi:MAG: type I-B CRISPR-associated endonuclease Cas1b [Spirochaetia bacterium]|nr:type I-B CRISPR-associated endonuclease Cas1b [Spirochaetota bacterium]MDW8113278.1 type I-B CRISPR-associated endonuclease Cas1b [Spirochaetia bacterium]